MAFAGSSSSTGGAQVSMKALIIGYSDYLYRRQGRQSDGAVVNCAGQQSAQYYGCWCCKAQVTWHHTATHAFKTCKGRRDRDTFPCCCNPGKTWTAAFAHSALNAVCQHFSIHASGTVLWVFWGSLRGFSPPNYVSSLRTGHVAVHLQFD